MAGTMHRTRAECKVALRGKACKSKRVQGKEGRKEGLREGKGFYQPTEVYITPRHVCTLVAERNRALHGVA
jgi:hypothetical protein